VNLTTDVLPAGVSAAFAPPSTSGPGTDTVTMTLTFTAAAGGNISIRVNGRNDAGALQCFVDITATVRGAATLVVKGFEVTSGVQINHLPQRSASEVSVSYFGVLLPAGKKTVARVFAAATGGPSSGVANVEATLTGYRPGSATPLPGSPLHPQWGAQTVMVDPYYNVDEQRKDPGQGFTFVLPPAWTTGTIELQAQVSAPSGFFAGVDVCTTPACEALRSLRLTGVSFTPVTSVMVRPIALTDSGAALPAPSYTCFTSWDTSLGYAVPANPYTCPNSGVFADARMITPVGTDQLYVPSAYDAYIDIHNEIAKVFDSTDSIKDQTARGAAVADDLWNYANDHANGFFNTEDYDPHESNIIIGVYPDQKNIRGETRHSDCRSDAGLFECDPWRVAIVPATGRPLTAVSHELWHMFGVQHASACAAPGVDVGNFDDWPPDQQGYLEGYGLDTREGSGGLTGPYKVLGDEAGPNRATHTPDGIKWYDLMGYCAKTDDTNAWISTHNWDAFVSGFATGDPRTPTLAAYDEPAAQAFTPVEPELTVTAIAINGGGTFITTVTPDSTHHIDPNPASDYRLITKDAAGHQLGDVGLVVADEHGEPSGQDVIGLRASVPSANVASLQIVHAGTVLASRTQAATAPSVVFTSPRGGERVERQPFTVTWSTTAAPVNQSGTDSTPADRRASLDYSTEDGHTWRLIYAGPDNGHVQVPAYLFAGSDRARLRITINDGFQVATAVSEAISSAGADPGVEILSPTGNAAFASNATVVLNAVAVDDRLRRIPDDHIVWYANDRQIATGHLTSIDSLPTGTVVLKVIAADSAGRLGGAQMCVFVSDKAVTNAQPGDCHPDQLRDPATGRLLGATTSEPGFPWTAVLLAVAAAAILALLVWVLVRRRTRVGK
jgi:hypothetical protein